MQHFILDAERRVVQSDLLAWGRWVGMVGSLEIARTELRHLLVLTSFAGIDISFGEGSPAFFETKVLDGVDELDCLEAIILGRSPRSAPGGNGTVALLGRRRPGCDVAGGRPSVSHERFSATGLPRPRPDILGGWFIGVECYMPLQCGRWLARPPPSQTEQGRGGQMCRRLENQGQ